MVGYKCIVKCVVSCEWDLEDPIQVLGLCGSGSAHQPCDPASAEMCALGSNAHAGLTNT